jgi:ATP-binding cassette subfamily B protein
LLSFARAIVSDPRILILDEATANIDTHTEILIQNALKYVLEGRTSLVIAHRLSTIRNADVIVVLEHGRVVEIGKHADLLERKGVYARLYALNYGLSQDDRVSPEENGVSVESPAADN